MQIFKVFYKCVLKRASSLLVYTGIFIGILVLMSAMLPDRNAAYEAAEVDIAVFDHDHSPVSRALYDYLDRTQQIVDLPEDPETLTDELFYRNIQYVLTIPAGFGEQLRGLENIKQPSSSHGALLDSLIEQYLTIYEAYRTDGYDTETAIRLTDSAVAKTAEVTMVQEQTPKSNMVYNFFLFQPYIFIAIMISSLGGILLIFRNPNLNARIQCSALCISKRNFFLSLSCMLYSVLVWGLFVVIGTMMYGKALWTTQGLLFMLNSFIMMLFSVSLTFFISFLAKNDSILDMVANVVGLGMSFLSGIFVPLEVLSESVKTVAHFLPSYWYVKACGLLSDYSPGMSMKPYFTALGIQLLFTAAFFAAALAVSKLKKNA